MVLGAFLSGMFRPLAAVAANATAAAIEAPISAALVVCPNSTLPVGPSRISVSATVLEVFSDAIHAWTLEMCSSEAMDAREEDAQSCWGAPGFPGWRVTSVSDRVRRSMVVFSTGFSMR
jgi:hypothetical protein